MWFDKALGQEKSFENDLEDVLLSKSVSTRKEYKTIHVSQLAKYCPRKLILQELLNAYPEVRESVSRGLAFEIGSVVHETFQRKVLPSFDLYGNWRSCDGNVIEGLKPQSAHYCGRCCWEYNELRFEYPLGHDWYLVGSIDGLIKYKSEWVLIELKTMDGDIFRGLESPLDDHFIQTQIYLNLIKQSNKYSYINAAKIVYINKDYGKKYKCKCGNVLDMHKRLFKSFHIKYNSTIGQKYIDNAKSVIKIYENKLPNRVCDSTQQGFKQYKCHVVTQCFSDILCSSLRVNEALIKKIERGENE